MSNYCKITNYNDFIKYVLERLGAPVINIEIADSQIRSRVTDALQYYLENHLESIREFHIIYKVSEDDVYRGYVQFNPDIMDVLEVIKPNRADYDIDTDIPENPEYWFMQNWWNTGLANSNVMYYEMTMQELGMLRQELCPSVTYTWSSQDNKLYLYKELRPQLLCLRVTKMLDPESDDSIWDSSWLKAYATALCGIQWATNLSKFGTIPSSGGLTINADSLLERYTSERRELEEKFQNACEMPPMPMYG